MGIGCSGELPDWLPSSTLRLRASLDGESSGGPGSPIPDALAAWSSALGIGRNLQASARPTHAGTRLLTRRPSNRRVPRNPTLVLGAISLRPLGGASIRPPWRSPRRRLHSLVGLSLGLLGEYRVWGLVRQAPSQPGGPIPPSPQSKLGAPSEVCISSLEKASSQLQCQSPPIPERCLRGTCSCRSYLPLWTVRYTLHCMYNIVPARRCELASSKYSGQVPP